jgi:hypothetical protein
MFLTFGSSCTPRWTACGRDLRREIRTDVRDVRKRARRSDQGLAQRRDLALRGIAEFDIERDVAAFDAQVLDLPGRDEILPVFGSMTLFSASSSAVSLTGMEDGGWVAMGRGV